MPLHVAIVIALTVVVSATTTFMTVRQSAKRGLMQTNVDPDNPMAQSQKYMMYIVPFFSLTGLYWQYGLVLYWVTTNLWTLGQQYFMFRNWTTEPVGAAGALAGATTGGPVRATQSSLRPQRSGVRCAPRRPVRPEPPRRPAGRGPDRRRPARGPGRPAAERHRPGSSGSSGSARAKDAKTSGSGGSGRTSNGSGGARTGTASRPATAAPRPATGQNGTEKRGLFGLGRPKPAARAPGRRARR